MLSECFLQIAWYLVFGVAALMYTVLDGFDLGVGILHPFARNDKERRIFLNSIGPVWDGNEVWLVIILGGLFAGFPGAYATILSAFYTLMMIFIASLIFRATAIEFRSKSESVGWRKFWDFFFFLSSILIAFILGVGLGNFVLGIALDSNHVYVGNFWHFLRPFPILTGITVVFLLAMHGSIYLVMKTDGEEHEYIRKWVAPCIFLFFVFYVITSIVILTTIPYMTDRMESMPWLFGIPILAFLVILSVPFFIKKEYAGWAFISSCLSQALLFIVYGVGTFPNILRSSLNPHQNSITIFNSSSSVHTLEILLLIVLIGLPFVFAYGFWIYRIFRGKVRINKHSY